MSISKVIHFLDEIARCVAIGFLIGTMIAVVLGFTALLWVCAGWGLGVYWLVLVASVYYVLFRTEGGAQ